RKGELAGDLDEVFGLFPRLAERRTQLGGTMSGGEQQMLAIGRAMMTKPRVLLLDEPSMGLAPKLVAQIFDIIAEINRRGTTVLLVEQNARQALQLAHRAYVLETGRVVKSAPAGELLDDPEVRAAYLGGGAAGSGAKGAPEPRGRRSCRRAQPGGGGRSSGGPRRAVAAPRRGPVTVPARSLRPTRIIEADPDHWAGS